MVAALDPVRLGSTLVVAPHPDDESIGCGGLIGCLRSSDLVVFVVIATDGSGSHPGSREFPAERLAALRATETVTALAILGVDRDRIVFSGLKDRFVPGEDAPGIDAAVADARMVLDRLLPSTLVIPSPADAHGDHRAVGAIWRRASATTKPRPRILEYLVWPTEHVPVAGKVLEVDISGSLSAKKQAIAAHRSQHGLVVRDDPRGFVLPPGLLARAARPVETYFEQAP